MDAVVTLQLDARPTIVAREVAVGLGKRWEWLLEHGDVGALRMAVADGLAGTAQRRDEGGRFVLLAWNVPRQAELSVPLAAERKAKAELMKALAPNGCTPRVYRQAARAVGMRTIVPYMHEPARWG